MPPGLSTSVSDTGILRFDQFVGDAIALGGVLQDDLEVELLGDAQGGHQVVGAMAVEVDGALAFQHLDERFQGQVGVGRRRLSCRSAAFLR